MIALDIAWRRGDFSLTCAFESRARLLALYGPSGAGKSTLANLIAGLARPDAGKIALGGEVVVDVARRVFLAPEKRRVGFVFQDALLFPHLTVRQNILFGRFFTPPAERRVAFGPVVETLGVSHLLDRRPRNLSGGERQRVGLARALLASPRLLVMDEPMAALDRARRQEIMTLIERMRDEFQIPMALVSHSGEEILRLADEVATFAAGRLTALGPPAEILPGASRSIAGGRFDITSVLRSPGGVVDEAHGVTRLAHPAGDIVVAARLAPGPARVVLRATDVALARSRPETSVRTILRGRIMSIDATDSPFAFARLELVGGETLTAAVTRLALDELGLAAGDDIYAAVKAVALDERDIGA